MSIELRWVEREVLVESPHVAYRDGRPVMDVHIERVLQYRINTGPRIVKELDGSMGVQDGDWSDWTDVPVVTEDSK